MRVSGKKAELQDRLREHFTVGATASEDSSSVDTSVMDEFESMKVADLRDALVARGLPKAGKKKELLERIRKDIEFSKQVVASPPSGGEGQAAITKVLEQAAKLEGGALAEYMAEVKQNANKVPKFVDVTITSLGLMPEKYTPGGAASATADVLKKLAGEPFADPPRYGSVSWMLDAGHYVRRKDVSNSFLYFFLTQPSS